MTSAPILELDGLGKSYRAFASMWWRAVGWVTGTPTHFTDHWVLRDVNLRMCAGESIGIVGRNGAGKSTLLKLIAGTVAPTEGRAVVRASVSALLELGMGFNPEFTGRENAAHVCGLLGLDGAETGELLPWIESFADVGAYFDQPMRTYSSGMYVRVAFAVATARRSDILIVDEALSVGDAAFQRKSFRRIEDFLAMGTSLLFVSHGSDTVRKLCQRAIWLDRGHVELDGPAKTVTDAYEKALFGGTLASAAERLPSAHGFIDEHIAGTSMEVDYGDGTAKIVSVRLTNSLGQLMNVIPIGEQFTISCEVQFLASCRDAHFGMAIKTVEGVIVYGTNTDRAGLRSNFDAGEIACVSFVLQNNLCPGTYYVNCGASRPGDEGRSFMHRRVDVMAFRVLARSPSEAIAGHAYLASAVSVVSRWPESR